MTDLRGRSAGAEPDVRRVVRSWLSEERHEDATRVLGVVLNGLDAAPQRRTRGSAWRTSFMSKTIQYGLAAAAVVIVAVVGYQLLGGSGVGEPTPTETPQPTATPTTSLEPSAPADGSLPVGSSHVLWDHSGSLGIKISVTIPATGWFSDEEGLLVKNRNSDPPDGAGLLVFARTNDLLVGLGDIYVYGDPCHWAGTKPDAPVTTVAEAIAALSAQASRDASTPVAVTYGGYVGKAITLRVPTDAVFGDCDQGEYRTLVQGEDAARNTQAPGQYHLLTVLDVSGTLVIFDVSYYEGTPQSVLDELAGIVESAVLEYTP